MSQYGIDSDSIFNALKEVYSDTINKTFNESNFLLKRILTTSEGVENATSGGKHKVQVLELAGATSAGSRNEGQLLPEPGKSVYRETLIKLNTFSANVGVTGLAEAISNDPVKAVKSKELTNAFKQATNAAIRSFNRQMHKDSSGALFQIQVTGSSPTWTCEYSDKQVKNAGWVQLGELFQIAPDADSVDPSEAYVVVDVDPRNQTFDIKRHRGSGTPNDGDWVFEEGSIKNTLAGLDQAISDETSVFQGLDPNDPGLKNAWRAVRHDAGGKPVTAEIIDDLLEEITVLSGVDYVSSYGDRDKCLITTDRQQMKNLYAENKDMFRFNPSTDGDIKTGGNNYENLILPSGQKVIASTEMKPNTIRVINTNDVNLLTSKGGWSHLHGDEFKNYERRDTKEIIIIRYAQLAWLRRNSHGEVYGLSDNPVSS